MKFLVEESGKEEWFDGMITGGTTGGRRGAYTPQTARGAEGWGVWPGRGADAMLCSRYLHGHS